LCLFAGLALVWFGRNMNWTEASVVIRRADWGLIALAVVIVWLTYLIRAFRWKTLLAPLAPRASLREAFAATTVGFSAIFLLGRAGEVVRPAFLPVRDRAVRPGAAFVTIAVERVCDTAAVILLFAANLLVLRLPGVDRKAYELVREAGLILLVCALVGLAALFCFRRYAAATTAWLEARLERLPRVLRRVGQVVIGLFEQLAQALGVLTDGRTLLATVGWTAALWAAVTVANMLVLRAFGLSVGVSETVFVLGWSLIGSIVPTPGAGAGTFHAATAYGLMNYLGFPENDAKAAVIILHLVVFGSSLFFGLYYFLRSGFSVARLRELISAEAAEAAAAAHVIRPPDEGEEVSGAARA
jgi:uncharacterized protein (TIRG00374 family)